MVISPIELVALRSAARVIPLLGKRIYSKAHLSRIVSEAETKLVTPDPHFIDGLAPDQLTALQSLIDAPVFSSLALQAMVFRLGKMSDNNAAALREQIRNSIQHTGVFSEADLFQATDVVLDVLNRSVHAIDQSATPGTLNRSHAAAIAGEVAASAVRNSELLQRLTTLNDINAFAKTLRAQARVMHTKIGTSHMGEASGVDYTKLYITPTISAAGDDPDLDSLVAQSLRRVILGDPGAGKSTLANKLVHDLAEDELSELEGQVPILLVVRQHTQALRMEHNTLLHYLEAACRQPYNVEPPLDALEYLLLNGRATVIVDGLDELGDSHYRRTFTDLVDGFAHRYPLARVIVTSRIVGYKDAPLNETLFPIANISPFTTAQVTRYSRRWFSLDSSIADHEIASWVESFMLASDQAKDLRSNPLVLSLLCALFTTQRSLPQKKPEIYEQCAELLFDTWDRQRGIKAPYRFAAHIRPAVQKIAWLLFTDPGGRQAVPRPELRRFLAEYMIVKRFPDPDDAIQAADDFLDFCADRAWVLTELGSDTLHPFYGFVHRTFLEFFAASQLVKRKPSPDAVWQTLRSNVSVSEWDVVSQLAVQILNENYDDGADELLQLVLGEDSPDLSLDRPESPVFLTFAARTLDNVAPNNSTLASIATKATELACSVPVSRRKRVGPLKASYIEEDAPLAAIVRMQNPDNAERAARVVTDVLHECTVRLGPDSSSGLLYAAFWQLQLYSPVGDYINLQLAEREAPVTASAWRYTIFSPSANDIAKHGLASLYENTEICGFQVPSIMFRLLSASFRDAASQESVPLTRFLEESYLTIAEEWPPHLDVHELDDELLKGVRDLRSSDIEALSPRAKASFLLLLVPTLRYFADSYYASTKTTVVKRLTAVASGRGSAGQQSAAIRMLNGWALPSEAHNILVRYITHPPQT